MNKHYFIELLQKYMKGEATIEEKRFVTSYYNLFENEPDVTDLLSAGKKEVLQRDLQNAIWEQISKQEATPATAIPAISIVPSARPARIGWRMASIAASIALIVAAVWWFSGHSRQTRAGTDAQPEAIVSMVNQKQENHLVSLPDGSTVVLGFGSKLDYPTSFDDLGKREVYLEGQAFFDIRHNATKPFIVHTGKLATTVLGTSFNIKAFSADQEITVTVKTGEVKVSDEHRTLAIVRPAQQIIYNKQKANSTRQAVATESYLEWKGEDLLFDNLTLEEAARQLEERFNVKISISDPSIGVKRFTTTFSKKESLEEALESICVFNGADYHYDKSKATVTIAKQ